MKSKARIVFMILLLMTITFVGCAKAPEAEPTPTPEPTPAPQTVILPSGSLLPTALDAVTLLKNQDMAGLEAFVDPIKGLRFTPYSFIDTGADQVFTATQIPALLTDTGTYLWGAYDGSGDPIQLTPQNYFDKFVYDVDFANPNLIGNNVIIGTGNTTNNIVAAYPGASFVEFHFTGFDTQYSGMDWESLRLVFEKTGGIWYLVGIVHDQWTI